MFDFGQIIEKVTGLISGNGGVQEVVGGNIAETLSNANFDPALLESLPLDQVHAHLAEHGIDVSALGEGEAAELMQKFSGSDSG